VVVETYGEARTEAVRDQVERILSLDVDRSGFPGVGVRDPVVGELQKRYPGLRPVLFYSPYEAAAWAVIGNRIRVVQAARIKALMAEQLGKIVEVDGKEEYAFPGLRVCWNWALFPASPNARSGTFALWPLRPGKADSKRLTCGRCPPRRPGYEGRGKRWAEEGMGVSVEVVRKPPKPIPEKVAKIWAEE
jgi:hypothetical protein